ncbi:MAG: HNH endonuclease [Blastocatellia bacterium]|nr:HNH endonuclease [Blastocatellia bacterium]
MNATLSDLDDEINVEHVGYSTTPEAIRKREWRSQNRDRARMQNRIDQANYRARCYGVEGQVSLREWLKMLGEFDGCCCCCGDSEEIEMDHIRPTSKGGPHTIENIQPLCASCNKRKGKSDKDYRHD